MIDPSARALEYAHEVRWPNDRIALARLCERYADKRARERDAEIARLLGPPGADAMQRARLISLPKGEYAECVENIARALQQYGDERAREARAAAIDDLNFPDDGSER